MRLAQLLFSQGFGTRRECAALIGHGLVEMEGTGGAIDEPEHDVGDPAGRWFRVRGERWPYRERALVVLHKPVGTECSLKPKHHPSVHSLLRAPLRGRGVQAIGRLDADTSGVLLFTDDGALLHRLTSPKHHVPKVYEVGCRHPVDAALPERLLAGVLLHDENQTVRAAACAATGERTLRLTLTEGKYHQVKRMVAAAGNRVETLHRSAFGPIGLDGLAVGTWRWADVDADFPRPAPIAHVSGDRPMSTLPLLALPGLLNDERLWHAQADALAARHPLTSLALTGHDSMAALADAALARAPAGRFALAGFSMGGYVALEIMRKAPERVAALALIDTHARPDTPEASAARRSAMAQAGSDFAGVIAALIPRLVHPSRLGDAGLIATLEAMAHAVGPAGFVRQQQAIVGRVDSRPTLARIRCPTVVVCGRDDALMPLELHQESANAIAGARLVVLDACGHMAPLERPGQVSDALRDWLDGAGG